MANPFEVAILRLSELGFFTFVLPFMLMSAIFYGALRKSRVFGESDKNVVVNGVISLVASFMVLASPIVLGINYERQLSAFFAQTLLAFITFLVALALAGIFLPEDLPKHLSEKIKGPSAVSALIVFALLIGFAILSSSGLLGVFLPEATIQTLPSGVLETFVVLALLLGTILVIIFASGGKKAS